MAGEDAEATLDHRRTERTVTSANTDLLFSLFNGVEEEEAQRKIHLVRRGRPKKPPTVHRVRGMQQVPFISSSPKTIICQQNKLKHIFPDAIIIDQDDDPCLVSTMTESLLPFLPGDDFTLIFTLLRCVSTQVESFSERGGGGAKQQSSQQQGTQVLFLASSFFWDGLDWVCCRWSSWCRSPTGTGPSTCPASTLSTTILTSSPSSSWSYRSSACSPAADLKVIMMVTNICSSNILIDIFIISNMSLSAKYCPTISPEIGQIESDLVKYQISFLPFNYEFNTMQIIFLTL